MHLPTRDPREKLQARGCSRTLQVDRDRRESLRRTAERCAAKRRAARTIRQGRSRFFLLSLTLFATAVVVALVMFRALYLILE